jgi:hypothetical protein
MSDVTSRAVSVNRFCVYSSLVPRRSVCNSGNLPGYIMKEARDAIELTSYFMIAFFGRGREPEPLQLQFVCRHLA